MGFGDKISKQADQEQMQYTNKILQEEGKQAAKEAGIEEKDYSTFVKKATNYSENSDPFTQGERKTDNSTGRPNRRVSIAGNRPQSSDMASTQNSGSSNSSGNNQSQNHIPNRPVFNREKNVEQAFNKNNSQNNKPEDNRKGAYNPQNISSNEEKAPTVKYDENGLDVRLNRLIDVVADYLNKTPEEVKKIKREALKNPREITQEYNRIFKEEIKPNNVERFKSLEDAKREHPDKIVFMTVKNGKASLSAVNRENAGGKILYDGVMVESVPFNRTPFEAPSVLFADPKKELIASEDVDGAFDDKPQEDANKTLKM